MAVSCQCRLVAVYPVADPNRKASAVFCMQSQCKEAQVTATRKVRKSKAAGRRRQLRSGFLRTSQPQQDRLDSQTMRTIQRWVQAECKGKCKIHTGRGGRGMAPSLSLTFLEPLVQDTCTHQPPHPHEGNFHKWCIGHGMGGSTCRPAASHSCLLGAWGPDSGYGHAR